MKTRVHSLRETEKIIYNIPKEVFDELCTCLVPGHTKAFALIKEGVDDRQALIEIRNALKGYLPKESLEQQNIKITCRVISKRFHLEHGTTT